MKTIFYQAGRRYKFIILAILYVFSFFACDHGKGSSINEVPQGGDDSLKPLHIKTFTIKDENAKGGSVTFKGTSVTINKENIILDFEESDASKDFTCSENFPITVEVGKPKTLHFLIQKNDKYEKWERTVVVSCTTLDILRIAELKIYELDAKETLSVNLSEEKGEVKESNITFKFQQSDAPIHTFEGLPITLKAGETYKFKIKTQANAKYENFDKEVTVVCKAKEEAVELHLRKTIVCDVEVKNDEVTIPLKHEAVTKDNIKIYFEEEKAPKEAKCEPKTLTLVAGAEKQLKIYTEATEKYKKFERTIKIKREEKKELHVKTLTIHGLNAASKNVTIKEENVTKNNVNLIFVEEDAPTDFSISPQPFMLNHGEAKTLTISIDETERYKAHKIEIKVKREKEVSAEKTIDDAVEALKSQSLWVDSYVISDITLLTTIEGFAGASVSYECEDTEHIDIASGKIKRDIADVKTDIKATLTWNGNTKTITLVTTIKRFDKIEVKENAPQGKIITWDFSEDNVLKRLYDGKATHLWEIKSVDVKKKLLVAKLKKKTDDRDGDLLELEELILAMTENYRIMFEAMFGTNYISLVNKSVITWKDLKPYILNFPGPGYAPSLTDEEIFDIFKRDLYYNGSLEGFNALTDAERTKLVKDYLKIVKESYCAAYSVPVDTPDNMVREKIIEKATEITKKYIKSKGGEFTYKYEARHDYFNAKVLYDENKKWFEQEGEYSNNKKQSGDRFIIISFGTGINTEVNIYLHSNKDGVYTHFNGTISISQPNSFTLTEERNDSIKLQCAITNLNNGKFTLVTINAFEGTFEMEFSGTNIETLSDLR